MRMAWMAVPLVALVLAGCDKETGPEEATPETAPATAAPTPPAIDDPSAARPLASFEGMDADGNGMISSVEHAKAAQKLFQVMDADADGAITVPEMDAAREAIGTVRTMSSEKIVAALYGDSDGKLTLAEHVAGANAVFARMDVNRDDEVDRPEWDKLHALSTGEAEAAGSTG
jgi:PBP1b-binding outer membrane lipoprotein LpoB